MDIDKIILGPDNFKTLDIPKRNIKMIVRILSSRKETELTSRAYDYCKSQDPVILEDVLIDHQIKVFLLWEILRKPDSPEERYFGKMDDLENACDSETVGWLFEEYSIFKRECSPFSHDLTQEELKDLAEGLKKNSEAGVILKNLASNTVLSLASYLLTEGSKE